MVQPSFLKAFTCFSVMLADSTSTTPRLPSIGLKRFAWMCVAGAVAARTDSKVLSVAVYKRDLGKRDLSFHAFLLCWFIVQRLCVNLVLPLLVERRDVDGQARPLAKGFRRLFDRSLADEG